MKQINKKPEIMAPAGDWTSLRAAVQGGADAVYFGVRGINMRSGAKNFSISDLSRITKFCHQNKTKAYLTLNVLTYENELKKIKTLINQAKKTGVDAIICWDFSVIEEAKRSRIPIYISTQMSVSNSKAITFFYKKFGIKRFVLARECSLEDIKNIRANLKKQLGAGAGKIEIEVFAHGAMCVSISGRCFLSHYQYGKSANRGECLQPCRREYMIRSSDEECEFVAGEDYLLSPKDLCVLPFVEQLLKAGISSLKIEGRDRSPEYVKTVTKVYRKAIDYYFEHYKEKGFSKKFQSLKQELTQKLRKVYNRDFSSGFFLGKPIHEWTKVYGSHATAKKAYVGFVTNYYRKLGVAEVKIESRGLKKGEAIMFQGPTTGVISGEVESMEVEHKKVGSVEKGTRIAIKTIKPVRKKDRLYVIVPR